MRNLLMKINDKYRYLYAEFEYNNLLFFWQINNWKVIQTERNFSLFNTEETQA